MTQYIEKTNELSNGVIDSYIERINDDGTIDSIPKDPANSDYQRYLRWLENPNEVEHLTEILPTE
jgi:hypothetical protein